MGTTTKTLYDTDFVEWTARTAELLREGRFEDVDLEHVIEEIEDMGGSEKATVLSLAIRMMMHLIKAKIQPERWGASWEASISDAGVEIDVRFDASPSLRPFLRDNLQKAYHKAVKRALQEMKMTAKAKQFRIPETCPWTVEDLLEGDLDSLMQRL